MNGARVVDHSLAWKRYLLTYRLRPRWLAPGPPNMCVLAFCKALFFYYSVYIHVAGTLCPSFSRLGKTKWMFQLTNTMNTVRVNMHCAFMCLIA